MKIDKTLVGRRFSASWTGYEQQADVQRSVALKLASLIVRYLPEATPLRVLEVGCGSGFLTRAYSDRLLLERLYLNDLCPVGDKWDGDDTASGRVFFLCGDAERMELPGNLDGIFSSSALQWWDDPVGFVLGTARLLRPGGYWALATYGPGNLREIAGSGGGRLPYVPLESWISSVGRQYRILYAEQEHISQVMPSARHVLAHLKQTGVNALEKRMWSKGRLLDFCRAYEEHFSCPGGVSMTFHPLYLVLQRS